MNVPLIDVNVNLSRWLTHLFGQPPLSLGPDVPGPSAGTGLRPMLEARERPDAVLDEDQGEVLRRLGR